MSRQDRQIDDVLKALRQAEPRPGLEDRVLANLRAAQAAGSMPGIARGPFAALFSGVPMPWLAAATLLVLAAGTLVLHHDASSNRRFSEEASSASAPGTGPRLRSETLPQAQGRQWGTPGVEISHSQRVPHVSQGHGFTVVVSNQTVAARAAASDSLPPPPLPLTEQERLMLRLTRREPLQQLASLSKPAQDAAFQHEKDSVAEFFAPAPPLEQESTPDDSPTGQQ